MLKPSKKDLLHVATLGKSVGLRGEMKLHLKTDFPEQFQKNTSFYITPDTKVTIADVNFSKGTIRLDGCNTPEEAKKFTNAKLHTTIEDTRSTCKLEDGEYFWFDIIGCDVYENEKLLGKVIELERILDTDYLKIKTDSALVDQKLPKSFLVPYLDNFVLFVDTQNKKIELQGAFDILEAS
ncbi:MAG: 16S rRNA processing protein RimM [Epsilonproteobacteria bacterium]|nr:16S rRNA processing protein RimM [Campylobacterota bacterium]